MPARGRVAGAKGDGEQGSVSSGEGGGKSAEPKRARASPAMSCRARGAWDSGVGAGWARDRRERGGLIRQSRLRELDGAGGAVAGHGCRAGARQCRSAQAGAGRSRAEPDAGAVNRALATYGKASAP
ncbi:hypothetical protein LG3211_3265 [Lysobacter gummosus]|nr:hypothetical protein LG3211_3265 [Lysobacter gummosus]